MRLRFLSAVLASVALCAPPAAAQPMPPPLVAVAHGGWGPGAPSVTPLPPPIDQRVTTLEKRVDRLDELPAKIEELGRLLRAGGGPSEELIRKYYPAAPASTPAATAAVQRYSIPNFPGVAFTGDQLKVMYPGISLNAPAVASPDPFGSTAGTPCSTGECGQAGCSTTPTTLATAAGTSGETLTYGLGRSAWGGISTGAGCAATSGGISSGCASGACAAPATRRGLFRR